jgi:hypothetical protein
MGSLRGALGSEERLDCRKPSAKKACLQAVLTEATTGIEPGHT